LTVTHDNAAATPADSAPRAAVMQPAPYRPVAAALWMIGSIFAFSMMAVAARQINGMHDTFEIMTVRSLIGFVIVLGFAAATGRLTEVRRNRLPNHGLRNVLHFTGQNLWLFAVTMIPLAQVFAIEFTSPIWVIVLSPLLLGERITPLRAFAAALGFIGVLIVAHPDFNQVNLGVVAAAGAALCFALTGILTKSLTRHEPLISILFWLTLMQFVMGLIMVFWDGVVRWPTLSTLPWLMVIGLTGLLAHLCLTSALRLAPATFVMPIDFARLPLIAIVGATLYDEPLEMLTFIGAAFILLGNWLNIRVEKSTRKSAKG
jgi:drug/metabolite transporter (DMT)-like permease